MNGNVFEVFHYPVVPKDASQGDFLHLRAGAGQR